MKILLADDKPYIRTALARFFHYHKVEVVEASTGKEAWDKINTEKIDLVISDIDMPEMNGLELAKNIRRSYPDLPIFAFTGSSGDPVIEAARFIFDRIFNKPKDSALLVKETIALLSRPEKITEEVSR
jgi:CheY-like chemotaxis protein